MPVYKSNKNSKDGKCWFYKTNYTDVFGNNKQKCSKLFATKTEAKEAERLFLGELEANKKAPITMTFEELYQKFREYQDDKIRITTKKNYENKKKHLDDFMKLKCKNYTIDHYEAWKKKMNEKNLSTRTKNDVLKFWKSILNYGMNWYGFDFNLVYRKMTNFTNPNEMKKEMDFYTYDEFKKFIACEDVLRWKCLWETLYYCGLRRGEARGLTWDSIDFEKKRLSVTKQVISPNDGSADWVISMPKTRDSYRTIPMCDTLVEDLKAYHNEVMKYENYSDDFFVFGFNGGVSPFTPTSVRMRKREISDRAGVKEIRLHDFRHSCASLLINNGANVTMVAKYLGHTKIDETLNTYSHMFQSALDGVINIINDLN